MRKKLGPEATLELSCVPRIESRSGLIPGDFCYGERGFYFPLGLVINFEEKSEITGSSRAETFLGFAVDLTIVIW